MIALIDYKAGNLTSVRKALAAIDADVFTPDTPEQLAEVAGIIVPGVGHFGATRALDGAWVAAILSRVKPLIGITTSELRPGQLSTLQRHGEPPNPEMALGMTYVRAIEAAGGALLVTADHGNCELMVDPATGGPHTAHTLNPVPVILLGGPPGCTLRDGRLADLAPTILGLMGLPLPPEMTGRSLIAP